jgi:DNA ligase-1
MKAFARLYRALDETTKTSLKQAALRAYFEQCDAASGAWAVYFLSGRRIKRLVPTALLRSWCAELSGVPDWMFEECYSSVGDLAETMALLLPRGDGSSHRTLAEWVEESIVPLGQCSDDERRTRLREAWDELAASERFVFNKLLTGSFRVGVSQQMVTRALADATGLEATTIAARLMGDWAPTPAFFESLRSRDAIAEDLTRPYPFCLAHPLQTDPAELGDVRDWIVEWKWDGIRAQIIRRGGQSLVWSRGEEQIGERFPELHAAVAALPEGVVLDGEILAWKGDHVLPFGELQRRIGRKVLSARMLADVPVRFVAFDLLEHAGRDLREEPLSVRRELLESVVPTVDITQPLQASPLVVAKDWASLVELRAVSRERHVEGLMLKRRDSIYAVGRPTGLWWKWKIDPYTCDAVLIYAQRGHGRRASLYTDYTFAAWDGEALVPFAKAYSGLTDAEIREVDRFVRKHTLEQFGPVRSVQPELVFELAFENIQLSKRHKSGIAVRFPRIARWRRDKRPQDADSLESIKALLRAEGQP